MSGQQLTKEMDWTKPLQFTLVALTTVLFGSVIWSCNKDKTPTESAETHSSQAQEALPPCVCLAAPSHSRLPVASTRRRASLVLAAHPHQISKHHFVAAHRKGS